MKVDKTLVASVALHVLVIGWGLVSFSSKAFESIPEESLPVDVISSDQLAKVMAGMKSGKKENPKPLVEKVAEAKPVDDAVGKITEKAPVVTDTAPPPQPKPRSLRHPRSRCRCWRRRSASAPASHGREWRPRRPAAWHGNRPAGRHAQQSASVPRLIAWVPFHAPLIGVFK